jgi:hypothetical protein
MGHAKATDDPVTAYARQTVDSREDCALVRAAAQRHLTDLANQGKSWFPFYFDAQEAIDQIAFPRLARHIKGEWAG